jgi:hypothetical protein
MEGHHKMCACTLKSRCCDGNRGVIQKDRQQAYYRILLGLIGVGIWYAVYSQLEPFSIFLTYNLFGLSQGSHLGAAIQFFLYDTPKVMMLLTLVVFGVGIIRTFFTPERTRKILAGKRESVGNIFAALLGTVTPFCSCSAVPLFIGFVTAGVPLGVTLSFLIDWSCSTAYWVGRWQPSTWGQVSWLLLLRAGPLAGSVWRIMLKSGCERCVPV